VEAKVEVNSVPKRIPEKPYRQLPDVIAAMRDKTTHVPKCGGHGASRLATDSCQAEALSCAFCILQSRHRVEEVDGVDGNGVPSHFDRGLVDTTVKPGRHVVIECGSKYARLVNLYNEFHQFDLTSRSPLPGWIQEMVGNDAGAPRTYWAVRQRHEADGMIHTLSVYADLREALINEVHKPSVVRAREHLAQWVARNPALAKSMRDGQVE
jgi:hypothetical protein